MRKDPMPLGLAIGLLIVGILLGSVFTFGMQYWNAPVTQEEAIHTTAIYESYATQRERGRVKEIIVRFEDHDQLYIDGVSINDDLLNSIDNLAPGIELSMIVHPNSNTIMELHADNQVLLEFQNTSEKIKSAAIPQSPVKHGGSSPYIKYRIIATTSSNGCICP